MTMHTRAKPDPSPSADTRRPIGIERLLAWAFGQEQVQLDPERPGHTPIPHHLMVRGMFDAIATYAMLGTRVDNPGAGTRFVGKDHVHWDAETVAAVVSGALPRSVAVLVAEHARVGTRPTTMEGVETRIVPAEMVTNRHGTYPKAVEANPAVYAGGTWRPGMHRRKGRGQYDGYCTPVLIENPPSQIERCRRNYGAWWVALHEVRERLIDAGSLKSHRLTGEMPPVAPWDGSGLVEVGARPDWRS